MKDVSHEWYALKIVTSNIGIPAAINAYHAYVHSKIRYGVIFWGNSTEVNRVAILQKRCLRSIFNMKPTESCRMIFREWGILTVACTYIYESVLFIKQNPELFSGHHRNHKYSTRKKENLLESKTNYTFLQKNVHFSIIKIYNRISEEVRRLDIKTLKVKLKNLLIDRAYYTMEEFHADRDLL